ncbi:hypothetical protein [Paraglaciecola sp. L3A3]|uniref:hypothetical protein n=1 Tax=Paraglaciecola sp. L3A3 TaxID=2686358 RepID=UPI00131AF7A1|nr:hypothetical protein [Paraglaciecola sp. L3A3]
MINIAKVALSIGITIFSSCLLAQDNATIESLLAKYKQPNQLNCTKPTTKVEKDTCLLKKYSSKSQRTSGGIPPINKRKIEDILRSAQGLDIEKFSKMTPEDIQSLSKMLEKANTLTIEE